MLAGAGLTIASGGAASPWLAPLLVGGVTGLATGNLKKGLLAGLGAYGGAGLASSLGASGAASAAGSAGAAGNTGAAAETLGASSPEIAPISKIGTLGATPQSIPTQALTPFTSSLPQSSTSAFDAMAPMDKLAAVGRGATPENLMNYVSNNKLATAAAFAPAIASAMKPPKYKETPEDTDPGQQYTYQSTPTEPTPEPDPYGRERTYFRPRYVNRAAAGGAMHGLPSAQSNLGSYSDGGRLLRGPGDGVSDSIPAVISSKQPARLADGEFVIPARIVSELGNGSTEAGAKQLYAMMDRIQRARRKTTGKNAVATNTKAHKLMPA